ncbi:hypothetical protein SLEP1_g7951 [Rubroshorea leprosula]|uniref:Uncharacterized protein n=1 Tax=Rubroshorea leprosula TaxID=152421 RepID=A0AAV5I9X0_9ROSI|nr:hypothetical protein SLEP1_g7951 [Rubroshorea leprosula]
MLLPSLLAKRVATNQVKIRCLPRSAPFVIFLVPVLKKFMGCTRTSEDHKKFISIHDIYYSGSI